MKLTKEQAIKELWRRGNLSFKLDSMQQSLYNLFHNTNHKKNVWVLSRRSGKTYTLCVLAIELCLKNPNGVVKFLSPTKLQVNNNLRPLMREILKDCPEELKPEFKEKDFIYYFKNGSEIQLAGTENGHAEKLRGGDSLACIIDEAGSCTGLKYIVDSILLPTTLITKGKILIAGTPSAEPDHDFEYFIEEAEERGALIKKTVYDNPRITKEQIDELIAELGGINSEATRRELFCENIKSANTTVIPEFTEELKADIIREWPTPPYFDSYTTMDLGGKDLTAVLFGYYDFRANKVIIQDEIEMNFQEKDASIPKLTKLIMDKEKELWTNPITLEFNKPFRRISDINYIVTNDILKHSNNELAFEIPTKMDKDSAINELRAMLSANKIIISPKCKKLIRHLENVRWKSNSNKKHFARSPDNGHYDFVDALLIMIRHIVYNKNPYPNNYDFDLKYGKNNYLVVKSNLKEEKKKEIFKKLLNVRKINHG